MGVPVPLSVRGGPWTLARRNTNEQGRLYSLYGSSKRVGFKDELVTRPALAFFMGSTV